MNHLMSRMHFSLHRYWRFWNQIPEFDWNKDDFNNFENSFVVTDQLASCETVHVYVHQVNRNWDIVMDDMKISAAGTESPTYAPTLFPTATGVILTPKPTVQPTSMPTVVTITECPGDTSAPVAIPAGPIMLAKSNSLCILTKAVLDANGVMTKIAPVARSYDGQPWEKAAGDFSAILLHDQEFGDYDSGSQITLPHLDDGAEYFLTSYTYTLSEENTVARLLETATFGTTLNDLAAWEAQGMDAAKWVDNQMKKPLTSHREFFRQRVNPRVSLFFRITKFSLNFCSNFHCFHRNISSLIPYQLGDQIILARVCHAGGSTHLLRLMANYGGKK